MDIGVLYDIKEFLWEMSDNRVNDQKELVELLKQQNELLKQHNEILLKLLEK